jgi:hypothetical protein
MANVGKWNSPRGVQTVMSTELNSVTNTSMTQSSSSYDNTVNLDIYVDVEINLAAISPGSGAYVALWIEESVDGTNFPAQSASDLRLTSTQLLCSIPIGVTASTAQRVVARQVVIPPAKFFINFDNQAGVSLASSGNTVKFLPYNTNLNG